MKLYAVLTLLIPQVADTKCVLKIRTNAQTREPFNLVAMLGASNVFKTCPVIFVTAVFPVEKR